MVAYSFQERFAPLVEARTKTQTIRALRKRHARFREPVQLYTGMRTRACRKLADPDPICFSLDDVGIGRDRFWLIGRPDFDAIERDWVARLDGFEDFSEMRDWFGGTYGLPFRGVMIRWRFPK